MEAKAFADLHPVVGVEGVLIASQVSAEYVNKPHPHVGPEHLTTLISYDLGGLWQPIKPPKTDINGQELMCDTVRDSIAIIIVVVFIEFGANLVFQMSSIMSR